MTLEQIKEKLIKPKKIEQQIIFKKQQQNFLKQNVNVGSNNKKIKKLDNVISFLELKYTQAIAEIEEVINKLTDYELAQLLHLRYLENKTWKEIAGIMYYNEHYLATELHKKAIESLELF